MEEIKIIDPCSDPRWDKFVKNHPFGWIVHLSGWKKVIEQTFPHIKGHHLALIDTETNEIKAGLPIYEIRSWLTGKRLVSIPFATISDILTSNVEQSSLLINEAIRLLKQLKYSHIEVKTLGSSSLVHHEQLRENHDYKHHYLDLAEGKEAIWKHFNYKSIRYEINKANKNKIKLKVAETENDLRTFYMLYAITRKRLGLPSQPYLFFKTLYNTFAQSNNINILLALFEDKAIAGHFLLKYNGRVSAEATGVNDDFRKISPNHFLFWEGIKLACAEGYKIYDFGRTSIHNPTLMDFKKRWGTTETDLYTFYYDCGENRIGTVSREISLPYRLMRYMCQKSPGPIQPMLSRFCYRHLG
ncbi:MAG: GNAT family N-acetyltransferase [Smithella sp.]